MRCCFSGLSERDEVAAYESHQRMTATPSPFACSSSYYATGRARGKTARLVAGFCWPWSDPDDVGELVADVRVGDWSMPWNARAEAGRLAPGIPKSDFWASDPRGIEQVGCVFKGFEEGLVDFYSLREDRLVFLCWRYGEERITHWHEIEAGFAGRQPVDDAMLSRTS